MSVELEVVTRTAIGSTDRPPLLFVHGGCLGSWCWEEHFLDYFAAAGFDCAAVSLRAHGTSHTDRPLWRLSLEDYADDVRRTATTLYRRPVLIGHSLGGTIIQQVAQSLTVPAMVLLASNPPSGTRLTALRTVRRHPVAVAHAALTSQQLHLFGTPTRTRELFFTPQTPQAVVTRTAARLQNESALAVAQSLVPPGHTSPSIGAPVLVVGAECDAMVRPAEVEATALFYNTRPHLIPGSGHCIMLDTQWDQAASLVATWLQDLPTQPHV